MEAGLFNEDRRTDRRTNKTKLIAVLLSLSNVNKTCETGPSAKPLPTGVINSNYNKQD